VFGAGASYDSDPANPPGLDRRELPYRLPLADGLFQPRRDFREALSRYPRCKPVVARLIGGNVEGKLQALREEGKENPERLRQLIAVRYYLQDIIAKCQDHWISGCDGITNYLGLLDEIEHWRGRKAVSGIFLVTFNYDTLLEDALQRRCNTKFRETYEYVGSSLNYNLVKPHGSVNWGREVLHRLVDIGSPTGGSRSEEAIRDDLIERAGELELGEIRSLSKDGQIRSGIPTHIHDQLIIPAITIPVESKSDYECPAHHLDKLEEYLSTVKVMVTVGWRASERGFLDKLAAKLHGSLNVMVVSSNEAGAHKVIKNMQNAGIRGEFGASKGGFTDFVRQAELTRFLNQKT